LRKVITFAQFNNINQDFFQVMGLKLLFLSVFFFGVNNLTSQISGEKRFHDYVNSIICDRNLKGAFFSIKLVNSATGKTIFEHNPDFKMSPASILKVITTGIGFVNLSKNYTFKTTICYDGTISIVDSVLNGNLYVIGGGDPSLGSKKFPESTPETVFNKIFYALKNSGVSKISGRIIVDDSYFDGNYFTSETVHSSWEWEDIGSYYGTGIHGLNFCENAFTVKLSCNDRDKITLSPEYPYTGLVMPEIIADIAIAHKDSLPILASFSAPETGRYIIRGEMPLGKNAMLNCALQNPADAFEFWLRNYLNLNGIITAYNSIDSIDNSKKHLMTEIKSPPYHEIAKVTNYISHNLFADAVFRNISKLTTGESSFAKSAVNMNNLLKAMNLKTQNIRIVDGSGLSRHNLISVEFMCEYLHAIRLLVPDFHLSLHSPGSDKSTLKYFMTNYADENNRKRIFLKSGSMTGMLNYAGYIVNKAGETVCVAIMINDFLCPVKELRPKIEQLVYLISEL
jgi:D-alanyl-D-alanine carboxypeptidase/D-alanyl-D-alanine-endopeptidase (penicillin-binding protein 4)